MKSPALFVPLVNLVKQQLNGKDHTVVKANASIDDLHAEALKMKTQFGYDVRPDGRMGRYLATHSFFRAKFVLMLVEE